MVPEKGRCQTSVSAVRLPPSDLQRHRAIAGPDPRQVVGPRASLDQGSEGQHTTLRVGAEEAGLCVPLPPERDSRISFAGASSGHPERTAASRYNRHIADPERHSYGLEDGRQFAGMSAGIWVPDPFGEFPVKTHVNRKNRAPGMSQENQACEIQASGFNGCASAGMRV